MNRKIVLGAVAGIGIVGGVTGLVVGSVKRLILAKAIKKEADSTLDQAFILFEDGFDILKEIKGLLGIKDNSVGSKIARHSCLGEDDDDDMIDFAEGDE